MSVFKNLGKSVKDWHILTILGLLVLGYFVYEYSFKNNMMLTTYQGSQQSQPASVGQASPPVMSGNGGNGGGNGGGVAASDPMQDNLDGPASIGSSSGLSNLPVSNCVNKDVLNPSDLLPKDVNNTWANGLVPDNELKNVNLLNAGHHVGINTTGSSLRNPNLQLRSEPPNPRTENLCPWNNSTIEGDTMRLPLEIGCKC